MTAESPRARLAGLDWIRGAAAMWVLLYHVDITLQKIKYFGLPPLSMFTSVGYRGVELFFLLSGFVMARTYDAQSGRPATAAISFAVRRLHRILPAYFVVFMPMFILAAWKGLGAPAGVPVDLSLFLSNLLLLPRDDLTTYIPVSAWTLTHELMFYGLFMVAFLSWRLFLCLLSVWTVACLAYAVFDLHIEGWHMAASGLNAYFLLGIASSRLVIPHTVPWNVGLAALTLICLGAAILLERAVPAQTTAVTYATQLAYAAAFLLIICGLAREQLRLPVLLERALSYLGSISYGLYLVNYPTVLVVAVLCKTIGVGSYATLAVGSLAICLAIVLADLLHRYVEQPGISLGKRLLRRAR